MATSDEQSGAAFVLGPPGETLHVRGAAHGLLMRIVHWGVAVGLLAAAVVIYLQGPTPGLRGTLEQLIPLALALIVVWTNLSEHRELTGTSWTLEKDSLRVDRRNGVSRSIPLDRITVARPMAAPVLGGLTRKTGAMVWWMDEGRVELESVSAPAAIAKELLSRVHLRRVARHGVGKDVARAVEELHLHKQRDRNLMGVVRVGKVWTPFRSREELAALQRKAGKPVSAAFLRVKEAEAMDPELAASVKVVLSFNAAAALLKLAEGGLKNAEHEQLERVAEAMNKATKASQVVRPRDGDR